MRSFRIYSKWSVQTNKHRYTCVCNAVTLVWGLLRHAPNRPYCTCWYKYVTCSLLWLTIGQLIRPKFSSNFDPIIYQSSDSSSPESSSVIRYNLSWWVLWLQPPVMVFIVDVYVRINFSSTWQTPYIQRQPSCSWHQQQLSDPDGAQAQAQSNSTRRSESLQSEKLPVIYPYISVHGSKINVWMLTPLSYG